MDEEIILANVSSMTAEQLFTAIKAGNVTLDKLIQTGDLGPGKRSKIKASLEELGLEDDVAWEKVRYTNNEMTISGYITSFPSGKYVTDAKEKIQYLEHERRKLQEAKQGILDNIKNNSNKYRPDEIEEYLKNGTLTHDELVERGIPESIIHAVLNPKRLSLKIGETPTSIPDGYTEVYFWGMPGSGKTCALGALLSTADKAGYLNIASGTGYAYGYGVKNIFLNENTYLPMPTPVEKTQYVPFTLKKANEKNSRSVSLIELSGEMFKCFFKKNAGLEFNSPHLEAGFNSTMEFLKGNNRKIHFFFVDYNNDGRVDDDGFTQANYLNAASNFFNDAENNIFGKSTDAVYVVLTKSDLMNCSSEDRVSKAKEYVSNPPFSSFVNTLKSNLRKNSINSGRLTVEPFSLGDVYFQQICSFDDRTSHNILEILFDRIKPSKKSILDVFNK